MSRQDDILSQFDPLQQETSPEDEGEERYSGDIRVDSNSSVKEREKNKGDQVGTGLLYEADSDVEKFYDFQLFAKQLQEQSAEPIIKYTKSFLRNFQTQRVLWTASEQTKLINDFKIFIYDKLCDYEPFKSLDVAKFRNAQEGIEKLIMGKLYTKCYSPCLRNLGSDLDEEHRQDLLDDENLRKKIMEFRFIIPGDLDIPDSFSLRLDNFVRFSGKELSKINQFKAPRDKMICVLNSCKVIFGILRHHKVEEKGADNFIPLLIYTILKSKIPALGSNVKYIERFRYESFIQGEASYYLNSLQAAINFIITLEKDALSTDNDGGFESRYQENQIAVQDSKKDVHINEHDGDMDQLDATGIIEQQPLKKHKTPMPSEYILHPLDDAANAVMSKFNDLFSTAKQDISKQESVESAARIDHPSYKDDENVNKLVKKLEEQEQKNTLETLQAMFPEMDGGIIEDVCIAKKYRVGATVDVLLSL